MIRKVLIAGSLALGLVVPVSAIEIQQETSPGGIGFWLVEEPSIPIVALEISFAGGARLDPEDKLGVARMTAALLDEGSAEMDALAFTRAREDVAARFGFSAGRDEFEISARMLTETLEESIALLAQAMTRPRFDDEPVGRIRGQILSGIAEATTDPGAIAADTWFAAAFPDHPYGRRADGTAETVSSIEVADLEAARLRLMTRANATIGIVGAISAEKAGEIIDALFADLPEGEPLTKERFDQGPPAGLNLVELDKPQSVAVFGHAGLARDDPDFIPAYVMNYILGGGGFVSRLMEEVREKRGLAYSVYSYLSVLDEAALYMGGVSTANERMAESLDVIRNEWARMASGEVTEEELGKAQKYLTGAFPLRFDSNAKIANYLVFLQKEGLGADYIDRRNGLIGAVTLEDIRGVAKRLLDPEALSIVVVGQPAGL